jgi:hypothetical protein
VKNHRIPDPTVLYIKIGMKNKTFVLLFIVSGASLISKKKLKNKDS